MDRKWFPDFVRVVDEFEYTQTREDPGAQPEAGALRPPPPAATSRSTGGGAATRRSSRSRAADYEALRDEFAAAREARPARPLTGPRRGAHARRLGRGAAVSSASSRRSASPGTLAARRPAPCPQYVARARSARVTCPPSLPELSGFAASPVHPGIFWAHNDSGNAPALYALRADGTHRRDVPAARRRRCATPRTSPSARATAGSATQLHLPRRHRRQRRPAARACRSSRCEEPDTPRRRRR